MNYREYSLRELWDMLEGRREEMWEPFSWLLCLTFNVNRGEKQRPAMAHEFNPFARKVEQTMTADDVDDIARFLV